MNRRSWLKLTSGFMISGSTAKLLTSCSPNSPSSPRPLSDLETLNFGIISTESQPNQRPIWEPFIQAMSEELEMPVNAFYATSYNGVIEAMRFGQVHLAWLGGKSYLEAVRIANAEAFAQTVDLDGFDSYSAYLITNKNNPIVSKIENGNGDQYILENSANLTFALNDPNSTSGFLVPNYYIFSRNNVNPKKAFKNFVFSGSHEATALAVANNQIDVATNNSVSMSRLAKNNPAAYAQIKVIWTSPEIPNDPIAYRQDLPKNLKEKLRNFFYNYNDKTVLVPLKWSAFIPADDQNWNIIRELEIGMQIFELQNNETLDEAVKQKNLEELKKQLKRFKS